MSLRRERFDAALDFQGLIKSAIIARLARAKRTIGFINTALREPLAAPLYTEQHTPPEDVHVIQKNLSLLKAIGIHQPAAPTFAFSRRSSAAAQHVRIETGGRFAIINPGAAEPGPSCEFCPFGQNTVLDNNNTLPLSITAGEWVSAIPNTPAW